MHRSSVLKSKTLTTNTCETLKIPTANHVWKYLGETVKYLLKQKVAQNVNISLGYHILLKSHKAHPKIAQLAKNPQSGHPAEGHMW